MAGLPGINANANVNVGGGGGAGQAGGAGGSGNFEAQIAELQRVSEEAQAKSIKMRTVSTQLASDKKVADERVV